MSNTNSQAGVKAESTFATEVVVDRFFPVLEQGFDPRALRIHSKGMRATGRAPLASTTRTARLGGTIKPKFEIMTAGSWWWMTYLFGTNTTTGPTDTSVYTHTTSDSTLYAKSFTYQANIPLHPAGTNTVFTFFGCKVPKWELEFQAGPEGKVILSPEIDYVDMDDDTSLASASYATAAPYVWADIGTLTLGGSNVAFDKLKVTGDNALKTEDYKLKASGRIANQQTEVGWRDIQVEAESDFEATATFWTRFRQTAAASSMAQLILTMTAADTGLTIPSSTTQPTFTMTIPKWRIDKIGGLEVKGPGEGRTIKPSGPVLDDGTNPLVKFVSLSSDTAA